MTYIYIFKSDEFFFLKDYLFIYFFIYLFIYLREREREREAETQAEGEAGSMQGAYPGTQSRVSRITPWAADGAKLLRHRAALTNIFDPIFCDS